jgi:hypothetical protein
VHVVQLFFGCKSFELDGTVFLRAFVHPMFTCWLPQAHEEADAFAP